MGWPVWGVKGRAKSRLALFLTQKSISSRCLKKDQKKKKKIDFGESWEIKEAVWKQDD